MIIEEKRKPGSSSESCRECRSTEPGEDADGVWATAADTKKEKGEIRVTGSFASSFSA